MLCPICRHSETQVLDSRESTDSVRRRRECRQCHYRFTTYERSQTPLILVQKKSGDKESFQPEKICSGVRLACKNRPLSSAQIDALVNQVVEQVKNSGKESITSEEIGEMVQELLRPLDPIAYLRFTSVYQAFSNLQQFEQAIHTIH